MIREEKYQTGRNLFSKTKYFEEDPPVDHKAERSEEVLHNIITYNNINLNANEKAMDRIDRVIDVANWEYNKYVSQGDSFDVAYQKAYVDNQIDWKTAEDAFVTLTIEDLANFQKQALYNLSNIWKKYG